MKNKTATTFNNLTIRQEALVGRPNEPQRFVAYENGEFLTFDNTYESLCKGLEMIAWQRNTGKKIGCRFD